MRAKLKSEFPEFVIESAALVAKQPVEPIIFDVDALLPADDAPGLVFGPPGSMKSFIVTHLCDAIVSGQLFLERFNVRRRDRALFINIDAGPKTFRNRMRRISNQPGFDFISLGRGQFNFTVLRQLLSLYRGGFVAIDCFANIYTPDRSKDPGTAMREFVDGLRDLYQEHDCGGIVIDHPHRPKERGELGDYNGVIQKEAAFRAMWMVVAEPADEVPGPRRARIVCRKLSEATPFAPVYVLVDFATEKIRFTSPTAHATNKLEETITTWATAHPEGFTKTAAEKAVGGRAVDVRAAFDRLVATSALELTGGKKNGGAIYKLARTSSSGTLLDVVDAVRPVSEERTPSHRSPYRGDGVSGTGSRSDDLSGLCSSCHRLGQLDDDKRCGPCASEARASASAEIISVKSGVPAPLVEGVAGAGVLT